MYKPKVYTASTLPYLRFWRTLAKDPDWDFVVFTASWPTDPAVEKELQGEPIAELEILREGWRNNMQEIEDSDFLLIYAKPTDRLRGALIETGYALGKGVPVLAVGEFPTHTWVHHPQVKVFPSLRETREYLYRFTVMAPRRK